MSLAFLRGLATTQGGNDVPEAARAARGREGNPTWPGLDLPAQSLGGVLTADSAVPERTGMARDCYLCLARCSRVLAFLGPSTATLLAGVVARSMRSARGLSWAGQPGRCTIAAWPGIAAPFSSGFAPTLTIPRRPMPTADDSRGLRGRRTGELWTDARNLDRGGVDPDALPRLVRGRGRPPRRGSLVHRRCVDRPAAGDVRLSYALREPKDNPEMKSFFGPLHFASVLDSPCVLLRS